MAGIAFEADFSAAARALARLNAEQLAMVADKIANLVVDQTQLRISDEKTSPDGVRWVPWSEAYKKRRNETIHSLLVGVGNEGLFGSIENYSTGLAAIVGTNVPYGAPHQFGSEDGSIPARPYLGLSADNRTEIEALVAGNLEDLFQ